MVFSLDHLKPFVERDTAFTAMHRVQHEDSRSAVGMDVYGRWRGPILELFHHTAMDKARSHPRHSEHDPQEAKQDPCSAIQRRAASHAILFSSIRHHLGYLSQV